MKQTKILIVTGLASVALTFVVNASSQTLIKCELNENSKISLWPAPYLERGNLCFDVKGLPEFAGRNCVKQGGEVRWEAFTIVYLDGESLGRDSTKFRVIKPVITNNVIDYTIEWSRSMKWETMQHVKINRLTGDAISYFIGSNGGESYACRLSQRKL